LFTSFTMVPSFGLAAQVSDTQTSTLAVQPLLISARGTYFSFFT